MAMINRICFISFYILVLCACHDTRSFENVRKVKCGMTIGEIEENMGEPLTYDYVNDSTESRTYVYDNPGNGMDKHLRVTYENGYSIDVEDRFHTYD